MRMMTVILVVVLAAACGNQDTTDNETTTTDETTGTTTPATSTSPPGSTTTSAPPTSTTAPASTTMPSGSVELDQNCTSPEGYSISYPEGWATNPGDVVSECGQFHPEAFEVPEATDERVAAITAYVDPVPFSEVAAPQEGRAAERAVTAVDGLQAVRLEYESSGEGLWPEGTPLTLYAVDVGGESGGATLIIDTVGLSMFDYERNQAALDRMAKTLEIDMAGVDDDPNVVARYGGGGGAFSVRAEVTGEQACLRIPPEGEGVCTDLPAPDQLHTIQLENLGPVLAGVTGRDVFAVTAHLQDGTTSTVLPASVGDRDVGGFSFTVGLGDIDRFVLTDMEGNELRTVSPGG